MWPVKVTQLRPPISGSIFISITTIVDPPLIYVTGQNKHFSWAWRIPLMGDRWAHCLLPWSTLGTTALEWSWAFMSRPNPGKRLFITDFQASHNLPLYQILKLLSVSTPMLLVKVNINIHMPEYTFLIYFVLNLHLHLSWTNNKTFKCNNVLDEGWMHKGRVVAKVDILKQCT